MSPEAIRAILEGKRAVHPELRRPLTWHGIRRVLARENVGLFVYAIPKPAQLVGFRGVWSILLSNRVPARRHTYYAAHELAHLWLHVDAEEGRDAVCYNFDDFTAPDPREAEAELAADWMLGSRAIKKML